MKVKELIVQLSDCDPESEVVLQIDSEGNGYQECCGADKNCVYSHDDVFSLDWSLEESGMSKEEYDRMFTKPRIVVLYP